MAIELPGSVRAELAATAARVAGDLPRARWVPEDNVHLTLAFLGERADEDVGELDRALAPVFGECPEIRMRPDGAGCFPPAKRARVAWVGLDADDCLAELQAEVAKATASVLALERDRRPFRPHLTMARCKAPWPRWAQDRWREAFAGRELGSFVARHGSLMESRLSADGARYRAVSEYPMEGSR